MAILRNSQRLDPSVRFFTIGHSNRTLEEFIHLLQLHKIELVADVRKIPKSRHNPHFWGTRLAKSLARYDIGYSLIPELAGRRKSLPDSKNTGWRNPSFRGYADHMQTAEFEKGMQSLLALAKDHRVAIMCAEAVPWRCHRSLIADALLARKLDVYDIIGETSVRPHRLTNFAKLKKNHVLYPPENQKARLKSRAPQI